MNRSKLEKIFKDGTLSEKKNSVKNILMDESSISIYHYLFNKITELSIDDKWRMEKIAILSSFTFNQIKELLTVELFTQEIKSEIFFSGYNQYSQEILDVESDLYKFGPSIIIIVVRLEELFPEFYKNFIRFELNELENERKKVISHFDSLIQVIKNNCNSIVLLNNFIEPMNFATGIQDGQNKLGQNEWLKSTNSALFDLVLTYTDTYIFDINRMSHEFGLNNISNQKLWFTASIPYDKPFMQYIAINFSKYISSFYGRKKCLVIDLDNTIWGGVIGEDGINNIKLGDSYPGNVYVEIQNIIKQYAHQGIILALNSKNNKADAKEVFENHPFMVLEWDDFAAKRINWSPKHQNLIDLSSELNIGMDSFVFVDDSHFEIQSVRDMCPDVKVVQFSNEPLDNLEILKNLEYFNTLHLSREELNKSEQYKSQNKRKELRKSLKNIEDFYHDLDMEVDINYCDDFAVTRISDLTKKTNQFNLTTKRYSEDDIKNFMESKEYNIYYLSLADKFGDSGITGVSIIKIENSTWVIDTFLLSCRIIGRTVETAFLSYILGESRKNFAKKLIGKYKPTSKNILVENFYSEHGFIKENSVWILDVKSEIPFPNWIKYQNK